MRAALGLVVLTAATIVRAQVYSTSLTTSSCLDQSSALTAPLSQQLNFTDLYAQLDIGQTHAGQLNSHGFDWSTRPIVYNSDGAVITGAQGGRVLRVVLTGSTASVNQGYSNSTSFLSTLDLSSDILTFQVSYNKSALCSSIRSPGATTGETSNGTTTLTDSGCPYGPGDVALGLSIPLKSAYPLTTVSTQVVVLDPSVPALTLACYNLDLTPYYPSHPAYNVVRYVPVALLALLLPLYPLARLYAAQTAFVVEAETQLAESLTLKLSDAPKVRVWATVGFAAMAGRQVALSGSLRRFVTPEFREVWSAVAWFSLVGTVAVNWPDFTYPIFARNAWASLIYNSTLPFVTTAPALLPETAATIPTEYASQTADRASPLYLDTALPPVLLQLPASRGIDKWAFAVGIQPQDLFSVCAFTFLVLVAVVGIVHLVMYFVDIALPASTAQSSQLGPSSQRRTPTPMAKEGQMSSHMGFDDDGEEEYAPRPRPEDDFPASKLHLAMLHGSLTRLLMLFHLPLTLFAVNALAHADLTSLSTRVLAGLSLAIISVAWPVAMFVCVYRYSKRRRLSSLPVMLALGPLYTIYAEECSIFSITRFVANVVIGAVIGAAQTSGIAQACVILLVEVVETLVTSLWLPWGDNAAMGPMAFLLSIARIIVAVLLVVLSPTVSVSAAASAWLAYVILLVQGLVLLLLLCTVVVKVVELIVRFAARVPFDESRSPRAGGLAGAFRRWDRHRPGATSKMTSKQREVAARRCRNRALRQQHNQYASSDGASSHLQQSYGPAHSQHDSGSSMHSQARMLAQHGRVPSSLSAHALMTRDDESGYILSAFSTPQPSLSGGTSSGVGYIKPGGYSVPLQPAQSHQQPILRSGPSYHDATIVPAATYSAAPTPSPPLPQTGFARVGGGRASSSNPYQLVAPQNGDVVGYPPYQNGRPPSSSADAYAQYPPSNIRRLSQSAVIEMAAAGTTTGAGDPHRPLAPYRPARRPTLPPQPVKPRGFFGRFKRQPVRSPRDPDSSDDDSFFDNEGDETFADEGAVAGKRKQGWTRFLPAGKRRQQAAQDAAEEEEGEDDAPAETGFSVVRRPRPQPHPSAQTTQNLDGPPPPVLSVEAPSRPSSMRDPEHAQVEVWNDAGSAYAL